MERKEKIRSRICSICDRPRKNTVAAAITRNAVTPQYRYFLSHLKFNKSTP